MTSERHWQGTGIEWTHFPDGYLGVERWRGETWNPTVGCTRVSAGCDKCYAFALHDFRYAKNLEVARKPVDFRLPPDGDGRSPAQALIAEYRASGRLPRLPFPAQYDRPFSTVQLLADRLDRPLHWRDPRSVFVDSMADLFHEDVPDETLDRAFAVMALAPRHLFMILTKRPERMREYVNAASIDVGTPKRANRGSMVLWAAQQMADNGLLPRDKPYPWSDEFNGPGQPLEWPLPNVWLGTSVESQDVAAERLDALLATPAALHFVSAEPLLGPLDLRPWLGMRCSYCQADGRHVSWSRMESMYREAHYEVTGEGPLPCGDKMARDPSLPGLAWVLVGGESGDSHRPLDFAWVESLREQCALSGAAYFGKQRAAYRPGQPLPPGLDAHEFPAEPPVRALG